jgi:hypothetical protein
MPEVEVESKASETAQVRVEVRAGIEGKLRQEWAQKAERREKSYLEGKVEARGDDASLVQAADEVDDDLAAAVVVDDLELTDVAWERRGGGGEKQLSKGWCERGGRLCK